MRELNRREEIVKYEDIIADEWNAMRKREKGDVTEEWRLFKSVVVECPEICGMRNGRWGEKG